MRRMNRSHTGYLLIVLLLLVAWSFGQQLPTDPTRRERTASTPTASVPGGWQIATFPAFGLSLGHPQDWYPHQIDRPENQIKFSMPVDDPSFEGWAAGEKADLRIWYEQLDKGETLSDWLGRAQHMPGDLPKDAEEREVLVSGSKGVRLSTLLPQPLLEVAVVEGGFVYQFELDVYPTDEQTYATYAQVFDQMLSTVEFDSSQIALIPTPTPTRPPFRGTLTPPVIPSSPTAAPGMPPATATVVASVPMPVPPAPAPTPSFGFVGLRWEPASPAWGNDVLFYAKFNNTTGQQQYLSWRIEICTPDCPNWTKLMFQTDLKQENVPSGGMFEVVSPPWPLRGKGGAQTYPVRLVHVAPDGTRTPEQIYSITVNP